MKRMTLNIPLTFTVRSNVGLSMSMLRMYIFKWRWGCWKESEQIPYHIQQQSELPPCSIINCQEKLYIEKKKVPCKNENPNSLFYCLQKAFLDNKIKNSKWVWSGNTTITNRRQPRGTARKSRSTITRHQEDKWSKATSSLFPIKMIAILEWTQSNVQQNIEQLQTPTMGVTISKKSTTTEPPPSNGQQPKPRGLKCILLVPNLRPRFCCCWSTRNVQLAWRPSN